MYPPPQSEPRGEDMLFNQIQPENQQTRTRRSHMKSLSHSHTAPFAYEYVIEDGKIPFLAELHPVKSRNFKQRRPLQEVHVHNDIAMHRQGPQQRNDKQLTFDMPVARPAMDTIEKTKSQLKRAFSLSGIKSSAQSRYFPSSTQPKSTSPPARNDSTRSAPPNISPPIPNLILPTPSTTPDLEQRWDAFRNSIHSDASRAPSSTYKSVNFSLPRSSWASSTDEEDQLDLQFMRETAQGRFTPNPQPQYGMRRNKALQILGISQFPLTPPYTPSHSAAPSIYDQSRLNSRRASMEQRISHHSTAEKDKPLPSYPPLTDFPSTPEQSKPSTPEGDKTPRAPLVQEPVEQETPRPLQAPVRQEVVLESATQTTPRPTLKRKTSKFTEHLDTSPRRDSGTEKKQLMSSVAPPRIPLLLFPQPRRSENSFELLTPPIPQLPPSPALRRHESVRTPSPSNWGNVVFTAQARPIVAMGNARLIMS